MRAYEFADRPGWGSLPNKAMQRTRGTAAACFACVLSAHR